MASPEAPWRDHPTHTERRRSFIRHWGVVRFGFPVAVMFSVYMYIHEHGWSLAALRQGSTIFGALVGFVVVALGGGYLWGALFWHFALRDSEGAEDGPSR